MLRSATHNGENWTARFGHLLDKKPSRQFDVMYDALIVAIRAEIPPPAELVYAKVTGSSRRSRLVIILVVVIIVLVSLTGGVMLPVALIVPEIAIDPVGGEQLRMRAALDGLAA